MAIKAKAIIMLSAITKDKSLSENYRIIQCLFGVVKLKGPDFEIELSRENKTQLIVHPDVEVEWYNVSGKAVITRKECAKHEQVM